MTATLDRPVDARTLAALAVIRARHKIAQRDAAPRWQPRDNQREPAGDWGVWLIMAGRGWGKTRVGAEYAHAQARTLPMGAIVSPTAADLRDYVIEGESGILRTARSDFRPTYEPSKRRVTWPNGAMALLYSADDPESVRGPNAYWAWCDEFGAYHAKKVETVWSNLQFTLRKGDNPRTLITTTPRPLPLLIRLAKDAGTHVTRGSSHENRDNLSEVYYTRTIKPYEGTRIGRQEIGGELLEDIPGALWTLLMIDDGRIDRPAADDWEPKLASLRRIVIGVDPSGGKGEGHDEAGIVAAGVRGIGSTDHYDVLHDLSGNYSPNEWATEAIRLYDRLKADAIVAEANYGGEMVASTIANVALLNGRRDVRVKLVHASRGKLVRAEPIAAIYEQRRCHHLGAFPDLESEQTSYVPGNASPNRMDALVWALTELSQAGGWGAV